MAELDADLIDEAFDEMFSVNVKSHLHAVKAALPALRASGNGSVILTESTSAYYPGRGGVLYVSSKFAVRGFAALRARLRVGLGHPARPRPARWNKPGTDLLGLSSLALHTAKASRRRTRPGG